MLSEGALRAERISRQLSKYATERGIPEDEIDQIAFILLASIILKEGSELWHVLPPSHAREFDDLLEHVLSIAHPGSLEPKMHELTHLLAQVVGARAIDGSRGISVDAQTIRNIGGMLLHESQNLHGTEKLQILNALFYKIYVRIVPSDVRHHSQIARLTAAFVGLYDSVWESLPGPGEVFLVSASSDDATYEYQQRQLDLTTGLGDTLTFIRSLRIAIHRLDFERNAKHVRKSRIRLVDTTLPVGRRVSGNRSNTAFGRNNLERIVEICQSDNSPVLAVIGGKDRRPTKDSIHLRETIVQHCGLRAVIDISSFGSKSGASLSVLYFGPPFPNHGDSILHLDVRRILPNAQADDVLTFAGLAGVLVSTWAQGLEPTASVMAETGTTRRVVAFLEEALQHDSSAVPGLLRFVNKEDMFECDYCLRAADYVGVEAERSWHPEVEIAPVLAFLSDGCEGNSVYLIGNNGAGKSLALRDIAMSLASTGRKSFGISFGVTDRFERVPNADPLKSHFSYAGARTFRSGPNARRSLGEVGDVVKCIYQDATRLECLEVALSTLGFSRRQYLVPVDMGSSAGHWERRLADIHPLTALTDTEMEREELEEWQALPSGAYKLALMRRDASELVVFDALSSGEQQILTMIVKIVAKVERDSFVLLDEPEISLHVAWQRKLPLVLKEFSRRLECSFVVATHSPVVIASAGDVNDFCFVMRDGRLFELELPQRRSIEASLFEGFKTYTPYTHHVQERCAEIVSKVIGAADVDGVVSISEMQFLDELRSLKRSLEETEGNKSDGDIALIDKAIVAVQELLVS